MSTHHQRWLRAFENLPLIAILRGITTEECVDVAAALVKAGFHILEAVSYTHLTLPTNREV